MNNRKLSLYSMNPKLKLVVDVKADIENAKWFVNHGEFVDWFLPLDFQFITSKKFSFAERNKIITEYTKYIHKLNEKEILQGVDETRKQWLKIEGKYYKLVNEVFHNHPWPKGKYIGYASVYLMFPRNINDKTFYFPYSGDRWNPLRTIGHEMLHFIFFDYIQKKYGVKEGDEFKGKDAQYVWQVSETFNTMIENWKPYQAIFGTKEKNKPYPGCEKMLAKMVKQWNEQRDIDNFLDLWLLKDG